MTDLQLAEVLVCSSACGHDQACKKTLLKGKILR